MPSVKGSRQEQMIVVPYRPWRRVLITILVVVLVVAAGLGGHYLGFARGVAFNGDARAERNLLRDENRELQASLSDMRQSLVNAEQQSRVDRESLEQVQSTLLNQRERIAQLEEDILFYKNIMSPESDERGLAIGQLDLVALEEPGRLRYRLELKQLGDNEQLINGYANVSILGHENGAERSIPLRSVSDEVEQLDIRLRFRYFQNIQGELSLPPGFEPDKVQILAVAENGPNAATIRRSFGWVVQNGQ